MTASTTPSRLRRHWAATVLSVATASAVAALAFGSAPASAATTLRFGHANNQADAIHTARTRRRFLKPPLMVIARAEPCACLYDDL